MWRPALHLPESKNFGTGLVTLKNLIKSLEIQLHCFPTQRLISQKYVRFIVIVWTVLYKELITIFFIVFGMNISSGMYSLLIPIFAAGHSRLQRPGVWRAAPRYLPLPVLEVRGVVGGGGG